MCVGLFYVGLGLFDIVIGLFDIVIGLFYVVLGLFDIVIGLNASAVFVGYQYKLIKPKLIVFTNTQATEGPRAPAVGPRTVGSACVYPAPCVCVPVRDSLSVARHQCVAASHVIRKICSQQLTRSRRKFQPN